MKSSMTNRAGAAALAAMVTFGGTHAAYAATPEQACEGGQNDAAGKYAACVGKAEKSFVTGGDMTRYEESLVKCEEKLSGSWAKLVFAAAKIGASCPSSSSQAGIQNFTYACSASVAEAVAGGPLPLDPVTCADVRQDCYSSLSLCLNDLASCGNDLDDAEADVAACEAAITICEGVDEEPLKQTKQLRCFNDAGTEIACAGTGQDGDLQAGATPSYRDNGDGTITDHITGLMWEKQSDDGSIHDKDNSYAGFSAAIAKASTLNSAVFAGYSDWRLPNLRELESLVDINRTGGAIHPVFKTSCSGGCNVLNCSCTRSFIYSSSTSYRYSAENYWVVNFDDGDVYAQPKSSSTFGVRTVRNAN